MPIAKQKPDETITDTKKKSKVSDYLNNPNAQKKPLVIIALEPDFNRQKFATLQAQVVKLKGEYEFFVATTPKDLLRKSHRSISLVIISDQFCEQNLMLGCLKELKLKKHANMFPILFLSADPKKLIDGYHNTLLAFHEIDEYLPLTDFKPSLLFQRIEECLTPGQQRRSKRYKVDEPIKLYHLQTDETSSAKLIDISLYGAKVDGKKNDLFNQRDQVRLIIPIARTIGYNSGEFLKLSARVRRVHLSGTTVAVAFEHVNDSQTVTLAKLLAFYLNRSLVKSA